MLINGKEICFVAMVDTKSKAVAWYPLTADGNVLSDITCDTLSELESAGDMETLALDAKTMKAMIAEVIQQRVAAGVQKGDPSLKYDAIYRDVVREHLIPVKAAPVYYLNNDSMLPATKIGTDPRTGYTVLNEYKDTIIKYDETAIVEDKIIQAFYDQLENGDYLLYYLNEFRHNRKIPVVLTSGYGGAGKSTVLKHYTVYKQPCKDYFKGDTSTSNFGETSLILCEEADAANAPNLTLNRVKEAITSKYHSVRKLYKDGNLVVGDVTILFSANSNALSLIMQLYNHKGEDIESIRRRTSTFNFTKENWSYLQRTGHNRYLNVEAIQSPLPDGRRSCPIDAHLNYLKSIHYFDKFQRGAKEFILKHSPNVDLCSRLSQRSGAILEILRHEFKNSNDGDKYVMTQTSDLMRAFKSDKPNASIGEKKASNDLEDICPECFSVIRSNSELVIILNDKKKLVATYDAHIKNTSVIPPDSTDALAYAPKNHLPV